MRHCDPRILVSLVRIRRGNSSFCRECKFRDAICIHLSRICTVEWVFLLSLWLRLLPLLRLALAHGLFLNLLHVLLGQWIAGCHIMTLGKRHLFARHRVWLLYNRCFVSLSLVVSILNFNLGKLILVKRSLFTLIQKSIKIGLGALMVALRIYWCSSLFLWRGFILLGEEDARLHLRFAWILGHINSRSFLLSLVRSVGMLALTPLMNVLKDVTLYFHVIIRPIATILAIILHLIDQAIQIISLSVRIGATRLVLLLALHPASIILLTHIVLGIHWSSNVAT